MDMTSLARVSLPRGWTFFCPREFFSRGTPPPLEWVSSPPLFAFFLISPKRTESPGSGHMGVIGALVHFFPSEVV